MQIFGHRGAPGYPRHAENTIGSFRRALEGGADGFELDVRRCADGQIVVIHDGAIDRTTNGSGAVSAMTYSQLCRFDAGNGESIPLLATVLDSFTQSLRSGDRSLTIHIELRESGLTQDVLRLITERSVEDAIVVSAFDSDDGNARGVAWQELRAAAATVSTGLLATPAKLRRMGLASYIATAQGLGASALHVARQAVDRDLIDRAHAADMAVRVYTVNMPDEIRRFRSIGADAVFTDFPEQARQAQ